MVLPVFQYFPNYNLRDFVSNIERFETGIGIPNVTEATSPGTRYAATEVEGKQLIQRVTENKVKKMPSPYLKLSGRECSYLRRGVSSCSVKRSL